MSIRLGGIIAGLAITLVLVLWSLAPGVYNFAFGPAPEGVVGCGRRGGGCGRSGFVMAPASSVVRDGAGTRFLGAAMADAPRHELGDATVPRAPRVD